MPPMAAPDGSAGSTPEGHSEKAHLLVVSNRLPVTMTRDPVTGGWSYKMSSGGLVAALSGLKKEMRFTWIGWPGTAPRFRAGGVWKRGPTTTG